MITGKELLAANDRIRNKIRGQLDDLQVVHWLLDLIGDEFGQLIADCDNQEVYVVVSRQYTAEAAFESFEDAKDFVVKKIGKDAKPTKMNAVAGWWDYGSKLFRVQIRRLTVK